MINFIINNYTYKIIVLSFLTVANFDYLIFLFYAFIFSGVILSVAYILSSLKKTSFLKRTEGFETYEFGATSIGNSSLLVVNKHFYILGVLFIIFDVELMFLFPWIYNFNIDSFNQKYTILFFLILLMLGFIYEVDSGALTWYITPSYNLIGRFHSFPKFFNRVVVNNLVNKSIFLVLEFFLILPTTRKLTFLAYLTLNMLFSVKIFKLILNWDRYLYNSKFQFCAKGLVESLLQITTNLNLPNIWFGLDSFSLLLILLTNLLFSLAILSNWNSDLMHNFYLYVYLLLWIELMLFITFSSLDLFIFFLGFESITIPTFFIIYLFGSELTKIRASIVFLICSLTSSTFLTLTLISFYSQFRTSNIYQLLYKSIEIYYFISPERIIFWWIALFLGFAFKMPICPFHMWLPEAHAEAPTGGSVILAGSILKLGGFGLFRFFLPLFSSFTFFIPLIFTLCLAGVFYVSFACLRTNHSKQIIAYSSVSHMGVATIGLMSNYTTSVIGSLYDFLHHSILASGFFLMAGILYDRYEVYELTYLGGLAQTMPWFGVIEFILLMSNLPFPVFGSFVSEILILTGFWRGNTLVLLMLGTNQLASALYSVWYVHSRLFNGRLINFSYKNTVIKFLDINFKEYMTLLPIVLGTFTFGVFSNAFIIWLESIIFSGYFI